MKKITVNFQSNNFIDKQKNGQRLIDIRPHILNNLYLYKNEQLLSVGKMPLSLIVGSIESYKDIENKLPNLNFANWYWDDEEGLQLINAPTRSIKILDRDDSLYPLNRCFDFFWIKKGSKKTYEIAQSISTIVASHGKIAIPHPEKLSKKYYEQFVSTKYLDGNDFNKFERVIAENGITFDCVFRDSENIPICLIQNNVNSYNSTIAKIDSNEFIQTELFNVINYNLIYRRNKVFENLGITPVENWYIICDHINHINNTQVYIQSNSVEDLKLWRFNLGYPKLLTAINNNIVDANSIDRKYIFTVVNKDNLKVDIK